MLRIVTDGAADMPEGWLNEYGINMLPLRIRFGEETYVQGVDIDQKNFYEIVARKKMIPGTSLPSPHQVVEFYREIAERGDDILSIHISGKLSGTFSIIQMAAKDVIGEFNVVPFDSLAGSYILGYMCREARLLNRAGKSLQDILKRLEEIRAKLTIIFTLDNLDFARMNGRVTAIQNLLTSVLKIKPIIVLRDGLLLLGDRVRTRHNSFERIVEFVKEHFNAQLVDVAVVHAADPGAAQVLLEKVRDKLNIRELVVTELAIPVAVNLGPGTVGIAAIPVNVE